MQIKVLIKLGLIQEHKQPADTRVALTPVQCVAVKNRYPFVEIFVEKSTSRCFKTEEYIAAGITVTENIGDCDVLFGIKEIPPEFLLEKKVYFFFSHTIKKQPYNQKMLQAILRKEITLIDYETLKWENGQRVLGFGRFAGIVGAYNGFLTWGKKFKQFDLKPAYMCSGYAEVIEESKKISLPSIKIVLTGGGRVANGSLEFLRTLKIKEVTENQFLHEEFEEPVFVHLNSPELYEHKSNKPWDTKHFYANHTEYKSRFTPYLSVCDLLMNGIFWNQSLPRLFEVEDTKNQDFNIKVIADISCDVNGSVPITFDATTIQNPWIAWNRKEQLPCTPFTENSIDIMAVGNLPNELPRDASEEFGENLLHYVLPEYFDAQTEMIRKATIVERGNLTADFSYLKDYTTE